MDLSPEQFQSLRRVLRDPAAKASALLGQSIDSFEVLLKPIEAMRNIPASSFRGHQLLLRHVSGKLGGRRLDSDLVIQLVAAQTLVVAIGDDGGHLAAVSGEASGVAASAESEQGSCLCALCGPGRVTVFAAGRLVAEFGSEPVLAPAHDWHRSWKELPECMDVHFRECIAAEKGVRYWANKRSRLLLAGPDGTEKLFHHSLFWWCKGFITDALDVYGEAQGLGQDKTDITIVTDVGNIVIEVKWLGKNENNTTYAQIRISEGLIQVAEYLKRDSRLMRGYLVLYDARSEDENSSESSFPPENKHSRCELPIIYFLQSETPSELGHRLARGK